MGKVLQVWAEGDQDFIANSFASYGSAATSGSTPEGRTKVIVGVAGVVHSISCLTDNRGTGKQIINRIDPGTGVSADGTVILNMPDTTAGLYKSFTGTDAVQIGYGLDTYHPVVTDVTGPPWAKVLFSMTGGHGGFYASYNDQSSGSPNASGTTYFSYPVGRNSWSSTEASWRLRCKAACVLNYMGIYVSTARTSANDSIMRTRKNGVNGGQSITLVHSVNSVTYTATSGSDTIDVDDEWCISIQNPASSGTSVPDYRVTYISFNNTANGEPKNDLFCSAADRTTADFTGGTTYYLFISGRITGIGKVLAGGETAAAIQHDFPVRISALRCYVSTNSYASAGTLKLRKNGADAGQNLTITAGVANTYFETSDAVVDFTGNDDANLQLSGGTSGTIRLRWIGITELDMTSVGSTSPMMGV